MTNDCTDIETDEQLSRCTVIVVDDEQNILQSLQRVFRKEPFQVIYAKSGADGLELIARTEHVAVIVSDQRMPLMKGSEFLARSRDIVPNAVRILLSGYSEIDTTMTAMNEGGVSRFIAKPWDEDLLLQAVREGVSMYRDTLQASEAPSPGI